MKATLVYDGCTVRRKPETMPHGLYRRFVDFRVRQATAADAREIADLNGVVQTLHFDHRPDRFLPPDADAVALVVEQWLESEQRRIWLAEDDHGVPVGYVIGVRIDRPPNALVAGATIVELDQVVVDPSARGHGVATALSSSVLEWASALGADRVELSTWAFNVPAQSLFARLGFTPDFVRLSRRATDVDVPTGGIPPRL